MLRLKDVDWKENYEEKTLNRSRSETERLWDAESQADQYFRHWGEYLYYDIYSANPPFESSSRLWYGMYKAPDQRLYELQRYDADGNKQKAGTAQHLLCGDESMGHAKSACGCKVIDVSEEGRVLLAYCRQQRGDFAGMVQRQWLSIFRSDTLSTVGMIDLPKGSEALQALAHGDGQAFVVTLEHGETLRIYSIPQNLTDSLNLSAGPLHQ